MENKSPILPSELDEYIQWTIRSKIEKSLLVSEVVNIDLYVEACILHDCNFLPEHIPGCYYLDPTVTLEEIVESFRQGCPEAEITQSAPGVYKLKFSDTDWTIQNIIPEEETPVRIAYKGHILRSFEPTNKSPEILRRVNSLAPVIRKAIQELSVECSRQLLIKKIMRNFNNHG